MKTALRLLIVTCLLLTASVAFAGDYWNLSSNRYSYSYSLTRCYDSFYAFPQQNTYIYRQDLGSGISIYSSGPLVQYGVQSSPYPVQSRGWFYR